MTRLLALAAFAAVTTGPAVAGPGVMTNGAAALATATPPPEWEPDPRTDVQAGRADRGKSQVRTLVLTVTSKGAAGAPDRFSLLSCKPPRGPHPKPREACALLARVGGDPARLDPDPSVVCPLDFDPVFDPVTVTANGIWKGRYVWFERTYGNSCLVHAMTDVLFEF